MIKSIHLQNWKSFRDATLYFDPLTILIGTNASGKSNALDAIDFLARMGQGKDLATCLRSESNGDSFRGGVDWVATKGEKSFTITIKVSGEEENVEYEYSLEVTPSPKPLVTSEKLLRHKRRPRSKTHVTTLQIFWTDTCQPEDPAITARLYNEKRGTPRPMQRGIPILSQLQIGVANIQRQEILSAIKAVSAALSRLFLLNPIPSHMRDYCQKADRLSHDGSNLAGVIAALPEDQKAQIESTILSYVSELPEKDITSLKAELYGPFHSDAMLICQEQWSEFDLPLDVDARAMSDGTLRFIAILTALLTLPERTQLVIEEIDNGLREIGSKRAVDVVATTHNPALLDALGPEMVPFVIVAHRDPESGDSKLTLLEDVANLPKLMAQGRLGAVATSGALERSLNPSSPDHGHR